MMCAKECSCSLVIPRCVAFSMVAGTKGEKKNMEACDKFLKARSYSTDSKNFLRRSIHETMSAFNEVIR